MTTRTRFAPSPTGYLHVGGARTALYSWLHARQNNGKFILRIEDTDRERSTQESVDAILEGMQWLGLDYDEGPFYQTHRFDRYKEVIQQLLDSGDAYHCYCSREELDALRQQQMENKLKPRYDGKCRDQNEARDGVVPVIRFRNPDTGSVVINDLIKGEIVINNSELDDLIIARSDGTPTYNLTVVVDDWDMGINYVIRGDDHINNTPRQINILKALGAEIPRYAHVPMILGDDGARLSKRHGAVGVMQYRDDGYLPEALLNYLVRLGWSHGDQEIFSREELLDKFRIEDVNRAASAFNTSKLVWLNQQYIMSSPAEKVAEQLAWHMEKRGYDLAHGPTLEEIVEILRERSKTLVEMADSCDFFYQDIDGYEEKAARKNLNEEAVPVLQYLIDHLAGLEWEAQQIHACIQDAATHFDIKMGKVAQPVRVAVSGGAISPPIDATLALLGREKTLQRLQNAVVYINEK